MASTIEVTGWFSAKARTTDGIDSVGTYTFTGVPALASTEIYWPSLVIQTGYEQTTPDRYFHDYDFPGNSAQVNFGVNIPTLFFSPETLPVATYNQVYTQAITVTGGTAPYTFSFLFGSSLPSGWSGTPDPSAGTLTISGLATVGFNFPLGVTDAAGMQRHHTYEVNIRANGDFNLASSANPSFPGQAVTFTATVSSGRPVLCQALACRQASWITQAPMGSMSCMACSK